jgi:hypothetical protein
MRKPALMSRRRLLGAVAAIGAAATARTDIAAARSRSGASTLPARGAFVIRNAYVMTMDDAGDIADADVHVANGVIVGVGRNLNAGTSARMDGRGMIVLPGLVETHWHMWNTLLRSMSGEKPEFGYFRTTAMLGKQYQADDMYQGIRRCRHQSAARIRAARTLLLWRRARHVEHTGDRPCRSQTPSR